MELTKQQRREAYEWTLAQLGEGPYDSFGKPGEYPHVCLYLATWARQNAWAQYNRCFGYALYLFPEFKAQKPEDIEDDLGAWWPDRYVDARRDALRMAIQLLEEEPGCKDWDYYQGSTDEDKALAKGGNP
jgi:hypothetical protein